MVGCLAGPLNIRQSRKNARAGTAKKDLLPAVFRVKLVRVRAGARPIIYCAEDAAAIIGRYIGDEDREHFVSLMLDVTARVIGLHTVAIGDLESCIVTAREVFKAAVLANAASIILGHNHPSGNLEPSVEDMSLTERLVEAGRLFGIEVLDHIIVGGRGRFASLRS